MTSNHPRNLHGMYAAPRCQALSKNGSSCLSPAVRGKTRCHVHGGKGSEAKPYNQKLAEMTRAMRERDRQTGVGIKGLDRLIRKLERKSAWKLAAEARKVRRAFLDTTQYKDADLAAMYAPPPGQLEAAQSEAALRAWISQYRCVDRQSFEMVRDRAMGALLGLAVGEALGVTPDGRPRDSYRELGDMHGRGAFDLQPGQWAGDTAMALALMESLTCRRGLDETDFMERLLEWVEDGVYTCTGRCIGIDETTSRALGTYKETENPVAGDRHPDNLGSGSLVRLAPVAIRYWADRTELRDLAARQSRTTHAGPAEVDACLAFAEVLADAIRGASRITVFGERYVPGASLVDRIMLGSWKDRPRDGIRSDGNVLNALEAALWCVDRSETFDEAVLLAVNLGDETARTAALAGQLAGAFYGACTIRPSWLERLVKRDHICEQVDRLFKQSGPPRRPSDRYGSWVESFL